MAANKDHHKGKSLEFVRELFEKHGLDALWKWAEDGKGASGKAERFRILEIFASRKRDAAKPKSNDRDQWAARRVIYAKARDKWAKRAEQNAQGPDFDVTLGPPHWGGSRDFFDAMIYPVSDAYNMAPDYDDKETGHAVGGDHDPNVRNAFAEDFPTFSGANFANAVGRKFGRATNTGTYAFVYPVWNGYVWRVQILWAVTGHFNHVHIGARNYRKA